MLRRMYIATIYCRGHMLSAPETFGDFRELIREETSKFEVAVLDYNLSQWQPQAGLTIKDLSGQIVPLLAPGAILLCTSGDAASGAEMELEFENIHSPHSQFIYVGKRPDHLANVLSNLVELKRQESGKVMNKFKLVEVHSGSMRCCVNCSIVGEKVVDMVAGPDSIQVIDPTRPARFYALGDPSRGVIGEAAEFTPDYGWKESDAVLELESRDARKAWLRHEFDLLRERAMANS